MADADDLLMLMAGGGRGIVVHFERFDTEPVYTYAVERGLNGGVGLNEMFLKLLKRDADEGHAAWAREGAGPFVWHIMNTVWRGQRRSRRGLGSINKTDVQRVASFLEHGLAECWLALLDAACAVSEAVRSREIGRVGLHSQIHRAARDTWAHMGLILVHKELQKIILVKGGHAKATAERFKIALDRIAMEDLGDSLQDQLDPGNVVEANINQCAAMISRWAKNFKLEFNFEKALGLKGMRKAQYLQIAVPIADMTIAKGGTHNVKPADTKAALAQAFASGP
eukprot:m.194599 g.194599  ORF g.194599 m.194599 type:complete len:282 (+) comp15214_c0_seq6:153-998(+)